MTTETLWNRRRVTHPFPVLHHDTGEHWDPTPGVVHVHVRGSMPWAYVFERIGPADLYLYRCYAKDLPPAVLEALRRLADMGVDHPRPLPGQGAFIWGRDAVTGWASFAACGPMGCTRSDTTRYT